MTTTLVLFPAAGSAPTDRAIPWLVCRGAQDSWQVDDRGVLAERAPDLDTLGIERCVLVVPVEDVLHTAVSIPARQRRQIRAALPFVVEEYLSEDVEGLHLAAGGRDAGGRTPVVAMDPKRLQGWLDVLADAGIEPESARVDADLVASEGRLGILVGAERALIASPTGDRCGGERALLAPLTAAIRRDLGPTETDVRLARSADVDAAALDLAQLHGALDQIGPTRFEEVLAGQDLPEAIAFAACHTDSRAVELLQGSFKPARPQRRVNPGWRLAAGLAAGWLVLALTMNLIQTAWLETRAEALDAQAQAAFVELQPQRTRSPNPRAELEPLLGGAGSSGTTGFLELMGALGQQLQSLAPAGMRMRSLNYNDARGDLSLELRVPGIAVLDELKRALDAAGYSTEIDSAVQEPDGVRARLRIAGSPS